MFSTHTELWRRDECSIVVGELDLATFSALSEELTRAGAPRRSAG